MAKSKSSAGGESKPGKESKPRKESKISKPKADRAQPGAANLAKEPAGKLRARDPLVKEKAGHGLKLNELVARVAKATGGKKSAVKPVISAVLGELGQALDKGQSLNLPGLGRARVARQDEKQGLSHMTLKLKRDPRKNRQEDDTDPLADAGEDG